ncbi:hypothetical protein ACI513_03625 [Chryseobacterium sp. M5]|uniref:hypothetical protein n=1 Tax=Chryseobacterium sp. M5 TaxID=3379128 RepID=UPI003857DD80
MKKIIIISATLMVGLAFAGSPNSTSTSISEETPNSTRVDKKEETKNIEITEKTEFCSVSCSTTIRIGTQSFILSESAGNIFTSCTSAAEKCKNKLNHKVLDFSLGEL